ncbi:hypothetical protein V6C16_14655 [Desulfovibrio sp. 1188_IL3213]|uniref:hypothetical protein n=1 Tax=Desulfovibrio sp. 1188_IL3213 TaxID=3084052 RepID=UPI002FDA76DC
MKCLEGIEFFLEQIYIHTQKATAISVAALPAKNGKIQIGSAHILAGSKKARK